MQLTVWFLAIHSYSPTHILAIVLFPVAFTTIGCNGFRLMLRMLCLGKVTYLLPLATDCHTHYHLHPSTLCYWSSKNWLLSNIQPCVYNVKGTTAPNRFHSAATGSFTRSFNAEGEQPSQCILPQVLCRPRNGSRGTDQVSQMRFCNSTSNHCYTYSYLQVGNPSTLKYYVTAYKL